MTWYIVILTNNNLSSQLMKTLSIKWWLQSAHFVKEDTKRPNIRFKTIGLRLNDLGGKVIRCAYDCLGFGLGLTEHTSDTKISKLDHIVFCQEYVLRFQVSVQYLSIMNVLECEADLGEPIQHVILAPIL